MSQILRHPINTMGNKYELIHENVDNSTTKGPYIMVEHGIVNQFPVMPTFVIVQFQIILHAVCGIIHQQTLIDSILLHSKSGPRDTPVRQLQWL